MDSSEQFQKARILKFGDLFSEFQLSLIGGFSKIDSRLTLDSIKFMSSMGYVVFKVDSVEGALENSFSAALRTVRTEADGRFILLADKIAGDSTKYIQAIAELNSKLKSSDSTVNIKLEAVLGELKDLKRDTAAKIAAAQ